MNRTHTLASIIATASLSIMTLATVSAPATAQKLLAVYKIQSGNALQHKQIGYLAIYQPVSTANACDFDLSSGTLSMASIPNPGSFRFCTNLKLAGSATGLQYARVGAGKMADGHLRIISSYSYAMPNFRPNFFFADESGWPAFDKVGDCSISSGQVVIDLSPNQQNVIGQVVVSGRAYNNYFSSKSYGMVNNFIGVRVK